MTTEESETGPDLVQLNANLAKIEQLSQRLIAAFEQKEQRHAGVQGPGQELFVKAATAYVAEMMANPTRMIEHQVSYWGKSFKHYVDAQAQISQGITEAPVDETPADARFSDPMWASNPYFNYLKQQYLFNSEAITSAVNDIEGMETADKKRLEFFSDQITAMLSPTNFLGTNPEALNRAMETDGQSLVEGLENMVNDLEANNGELMVTLSDKQAFKVGENIATSKGSVVFSNRMFELIQYAPNTETVHKIPLILFPPWINKFYILDLKEKNSLIKWIVDQGFTLFVVSWINPDATYKDVGMDTYVEEGYLEAIDQVKKITGEKKVNVVGYCIAGATLALTLSLMKRRKDTSIANVTFFTTLSDFSDQGEIGVFLSDDFVDGIEREVNEKGILHSKFMSRTFSYMRSNDLIYGPAIHRYMMGEAPPAFDLLFWNGDGTNLPARMTNEYLRWLCQDDLFAKGQYPMFGEKLSIKDISLPICAIACETDHIVAWKSSYDGVRQMASKDKTFILSESGHIAGIVNPPSKKKYGHYTNTDLTLEHDDWKDSANFTNGSWWPLWGAWLSKCSGKQVPAREPADTGIPAPGTYVAAIPKL